MTNIYLMDDARHETELDRARRILTEQDEFEAGPRGPWVSERQAHRTARIDPDDRRVLLVVLTLVLVVATAAGVASFAGQTSMASFTGLPPWLRFVVPLFIDLPIMVVSFLIPIFRARGESVTTSWIMLGTLTGLSSAINVVHVLDVNRVLSGAPLTVEIVTGCVVMGLAPIVIMISFEETVRLAVRRPEREI